MPAVTVQHRFTVLFVGLVLGAVYGLLVAGLMMPKSLDFAGRAEIWLGVMAGPAGETAREFTQFGDHWEIRLGWLAIVLVPANPVRPNVGTALLTLAGLFVWFFAGFVAEMSAVWGA